MKIVTLIMIIVVIFVIANESIAQRGIKRGRGGPFGWRLENQYCMVYRPEKVETISGEVLSVEKVPPRNRMFYGIHLNIKIDEKTIPVHLGPGWYMEKQDINIVIEDKLEITGSRLSIDGKLAIIATEVKKGEKVLKLRDANGIPLWSGSKKKSVMKPLNKRELCWIETCECKPCTQNCSIYSSNIIETIYGNVVRVVKSSREKGPSYGVHLIVRTAGETLSVRLGPEWYMNDQGFTINTNDKIEIRGHRISEREELVIIAAEVKKGNEILKFRNENGLPLWMSRRAP